MYHFHSSTVISKKKLALLTWYDLIYRMNHLRLEAEISSKLLIIWKSVLNESGVVSGYLFDMTSIFVSESYEDWYVFR